MERTLPARTARAASQVLAHAESVLAKRGRKEVPGAVALAGSGAASLLRDSEQPSPAILRVVALTVIALCFRKSRRDGLIFMGTSVRLSCVVPSSRLTWMGDGRTTAF